MLEDLKFKSWVGGIKERLYQELGFECIHDGRNNPGQFKLPPDQVSCYTMKYQLKIDGIFRDRWVIFHYDKRNGLVTEEIIFGSEGRQKMVMEIPVEEGAL